MILYHLTIFVELPQRCLPFTRFGWMGVDLFFVLSGFLIGQQLFKVCQQTGKVSLRQFYRRRAYRILPAYLTVLALYLLLPPWRESPHLAPLWKFLTFTMNLGFSFDARAFSHAWSLCVEEHFYLLLPWAVTLLWKRSSARSLAVLLVTIALAGMLLRGYLLLRYPEEVYPLIYYPTYTRLDGLTIGVALALLRTFRPAWWCRFTSRPNTLLFAGVLCIALVTSLFWQNNIGSGDGLARWGTIFGLPLLAIGWGFVTASSAGSGLLSRAKLPFTDRLATLAFSLYLTHKAVGHLVQTYCPTLTSSQGPLSWLLYATSCLLAAWCLHITVELPFLRLRDRRAVPGTSPSLEAQALNEPAL